MGLERLYNNGCSLINAAGVCVLNADPLEKAAKIGYKTIDLVSSFITASEPFQLLASHLKGGVAFLETVQFPGKIREIVGRDANGQSFFAVNPWPKCVEKVSVAFHSVLKAVRTLAAQGIIKLGKLGATVIGKLTAFSLVTDLIFIANCSFTIWESIKQGIKVRPVLLEADLKVQKWKARQQIVFNPAKFAEQENVAYKLKKWEVVKNNAVITNNKLRLAGIHSLGMICVTTAGIALASTNITAAFAVRSFLAAGIITDSIGLSRFFYDYYNKPIDSPVRKL